MSAGANSTTLASIARVDWQVQFLDLTKMARDSASVKGMRDWAGPRHIPTLNRSAYLGAGSSPCCRRRSRTRTSARASARRPATTRASPHAFLRGPTRPTPSAPWPPLSNRSSSAPGPPASTSPSGPSAAPSSRGFRSSASRPRRAASLATAASSEHFTEAWPPSAFRSQHGST